MLHFLTFSFCFTVITSVNRKTHNLDFQFAKDKRICEISIADPTVFSLISAPFTIFSLNLHYVSKTALYQWI